MSTTWVCVCKTWLMPADREQAQMLPLDTTSSNKGVAAGEQKGRLRRGGKWPKFRGFLLVAMAVLLVANLAMHVLEIARLAVNQQGIGLLPFCFVPIIIVLISLWVPTPAWSKGGWRKPARPHGMAFFALVNFWLIWMAVTVGVKLWSLSTVEKAIGQAAYDGPDSKYPESDRIVSLTPGRADARSTTLSFWRCTS